MHIGVTPILRPQGERHLGDQEIPVTAARGTVEEDAESRVRRDLGAERGGHRREQDQERQAWRPAEE